MLPSFAQAFANDNMSTTLPPIRKRSGNDNDDLATSKKRRLTHSPLPLRTDLDTAPSIPQKHQSNSTPISPVGLTLQRDLIDHVRSAKQIRKKQEALIEQRRESLGASPDDPPLSAANSPSISLPLSAHQNNPSQPQLHPPTPLPVPTPTPPTPGPGPSSSSRLPPPPISFANRAINAGKKKPADLLLVNHRDPPNNYLHPNSTRLLALHGPSIQSAPPTQNAFSIPMSLPRLPSNLISAPSPAIAGSRRVPPTPTRLSMLPNSAPSAPTLQDGKSPPATIPIATTLLPHTPTSLAINRAVHLGNSLLNPPSIVLSSPSSSGSAPPTSSNSSLTPAQSQAAAKQAFLAPFELFYDALQDARHLKHWLNDQLTRTATLTRRWEDELARLERDRDRNNNRQPATDTIVKTEEAEAESQSSLGGGPADLREELEWLRRRVDELEGRFASAPSNMTATVTASSSSSTSSISSSHDGYTFPQSRYEHQRERDQRPPQSQKHPQNPQPGSSLAPLPAISRRLSLSGRPELDRRLSSPGWHPSSGGSGHRVGGRKGEGSLDGAGVVSKSLSGPGTCGGGFSSTAPPSSSLRRRGRRVSISGGVVPPIKDRDSERSERLGESERAKREEREMNIHSVGGVEEDGAAAGGEQEPERREEERDRDREESRR